MGGYGATINGLRFHETFSHVVALSSAYLVDRLADTYKEYTDNIFTNRGYIESLFGEPENVKGSEFDYDVLAERVCAAGKKPKFFVACGTEDDLMPPNRVFKDNLIRLGYDVTWLEGPGGHTCDFWNEYILKAMDWLPLGGPVEGLGSGHIGE